MDKNILPTVVVSILIGLFIGYLGSAVTSSPSAEDVAKKTVDYLESVKLKESRKKLNEDFNKATVDQIKEVATKLGVCQ